MLLKISIGLVLVLGAILIYAAFLPSKMNIAREIFIQSTPEIIFPHINNSKKADHWMPWADSDPAMQVIYSGPAEGVGSKSNWDSPGKMGTGEALVVESIPNQVVKTQLRYIRPMSMEQLATISLTPKDGGTLVRWEVDGENTFIGRVFCLFMNMDKMVGDEFTKGLKRLKEIVENAK